MSHIVDSINAYGQKMYFSKNTFLHILANTLYDIACFGFKIKNVPSQEEMDQMISEFFPDSTEQERQVYRDDMKHSWMKYGMALDEHFMYDFPHLSHEQRKQYLSDVERLKFASILNGRKESRIFKHKLQTYEIFKQFYKRECCAAKTLDDAFFVRHPKFIYKLENGSRGTGAQILCVDDYASFEEMKHSVPEWENGLCEELIRQDERMAAFHKSSVNTIRVLTVRSKSGAVTVWGACLRTGRGDSIVDNAAVGGIYTIIDVETGIIAMDGVDERNHVFVEHPDSHITFKGYQIPLWQELLKTVTAIAEMAPNIRYAGWDMALSENGWVMVEGNSFGQILTQMADKKPKKAEFLKLIQI